MHSDQGRNFESTLLKHSKHLGHPKPEPQPIILKGMVWLNGSTVHFYSFSAHMWKKKVIGSDFYPWLYMHTSLLSILPPECPPLCSCLEGSQSIQIFDVLILQHMIPPPIRPRSHAKWQSYKTLLKPTLSIWRPNNRLSTTSIPIPNIANSSLVIVFGYPSQQLEYFSQSGKGVGKLPR